MIPPPAIEMLEQIVEEDGPVIEQEAVSAWEAMVAEAEALAPQVEAAAQAVESEAETLAQDLESEGEAIFNTLEDALFDGEVDEVTSSCTEGEAASNASDAEVLQQRAAELQKMRSGWMGENGTTSVIRGRDPITGEVRDFIATESETMPPEWEGQLGENEQFVEGEGHAEETILNSNDRSGFDLTAGGTSRNVCADTCAPQLEDDGFTLGGDTFRGMPDKTPYRTFWKP